MSDNSRDFTPEDMMGRDAREPDPFTRTQRKSGIESALDTVETIQFLERKVIDVLVFLKMEIDYMRLTTIDNKDKNKDRKLTNIHQEIVNHFDSLHRVKEKTQLIYEMIKEINND